MASQFNDSGVNSLFKEILKSFKLNTEGLSSLCTSRVPKIKSKIIAPERSLYLREIASTVKKYNMRSKTTAKALGDFQALQKSLEILGQNSEVEKPRAKEMEIPSEAFEEIEAFDEAKK